MRVNLSNCLLVTDLPMNPSRDSASTPPLCKTRQHSGGESVRRLQAGSHMHMGIVDC
jgi:hypothetical protein